MGVLRSSTHLPITSQPSALEVSLVNLLVPLYELGTDSPHFVIGTLAKGVDVLFGLVWDRVSYKPGWPGVHDLSQAPESSIVVMQI